MSNRSCTNKATIRREELEERMLSGLKDRLMTPEAAAEAMRAYVEETNRANHERRASTAGWQAELTKLRKGLKQMLQVIEDGGYTRGMVEREAREDELVTLLAAQPQDVPDIHPNVAAIFKQKVERLTETLNHPDDRQEASEAIRALIEKIVVTPGKVRGEIHATLHGELGTQLDFAASRSNGKPAQKKNTPESGASGVSSWDIAGAGLLLNLRQPQVESNAGLIGCFNKFFSTHA